MSDVIDAIPPSRLRSGPCRTKNRPNAPGSRGHMYTRRLGRRLVENGQIRRLDGTGDIQLQPYPVSCRFSSEIGRVGRVGRVGEITRIESAEINPPDRPDRPDPQVGLLWGSLLAGGCCAGASRFFCATARLFI